MHSELILPGPRRWREGSAVARSGCVSETKQKPARASVASEHARECLARERLALGATLRELSVVAHHVQIGISSGAGGALAAVRVPSCASEARVAAERGVAARSGCVVDRTQMPVGAKACAFGAAGLALATKPWPSDRVDRQPWYA